MNYDKHGTEIRDGDTLQADTGMQFVFRTGHVGTPPFEEAWTVLSRAAGTPIFRYADGRDVRAGDAFNCPNGAQYVVQAAWLVSARERDAADWKTCTLIRRAESPQKCHAPIPLYIGMGECSRPHGHDGAHGVESKAHPGGWAEWTICRHGIEIFEGARGCGECRAESSRLDRPRPILGKDRHGRDVRAGDCVRRMQSRDSLIVTRRSLVAGNSGAYGYFGESERWGIFESAAELVDDKTEPAVTLYLAPEVQAESPGHNTISAIESFLRALNTPTLTDRFEAFKRRVAALIVEAEAEGVQHVFDCDARHGPSAIILHQDGDTTMLRELDEDDDIRGAFETEVFDVGRAALGRKALAK